MLEALRRGDLDLLVGRTPAAAELRGLIVEHLYFDRLAFVARSDHPLAGRETTLDAILTYPLVSPPANAVIRPMVEDFMAARGVAFPRAALETTAEPIAAAYLARSDAVWLISRGVAAAAVEAGRLSYLRIETQDTIGSIGVTLLADARPHPARDLYVAALRQAAADVV